VSLAGPHHKPETAITASLHRVCLLELVTRFGG